MPSFVAALLGAAVVAVAVVVLVLTGVLDNTKTVVQEAPLSQSEPPPPAAPASEPRSVESIYAKVSPGVVFVSARGANGRLSFNGPGVVVQRTYRIDEAYSEHLQMMVFDTYGVGFRAFGDFMGNTLVINGTDAPWVGRATLARIP